MIDEVQDADGDFYHIWNIQKQLENFRTEYINIEILSNNKPGS